MVGYSGSTPEVFTNSHFQRSIRVSNILDIRITPAFKAIYDLCEQFVWVGIFHSEMVFYLRCAVGDTYLSIVTEVLQEFFQSFAIQD